MTELGRIPSGGAPTPSAWPPWHSGRWATTALGDLARYVVPEALRGTALEPAVVYTGAGDDVEDVVRSLYAQLRGTHIAYSQEPWSVDRGVQHVRPPKQMVNDMATCLDVALAFADQCFAANVRPLVAIARRLGSKAVHALVVVDVRGGRNDWDSRPLPPELVPLDEGVEQPWRYTWTGTRLPEGLVAVDPTCATGDGRPWDEARASGDEWLDGVDNVTRLVDVAAARAAGVEAFPPPAVEATPAIHRRLDSVPTTLLDVPALSDLSRWLSQQTGQVALVGAEGAGKSTLALRRAQQAAYGYGWVLTAPDAATLTTQLAAAELGERPEDELTANMDRESLARAARARLASTQAPWVVVVERVSCPPGDLQGVLPVPGPGQTVIVTTDERAWRAADGWESREVPPVPDARRRLLGLGDAWPTGGSLALTATALAVAAAGVDVPPAAPDRDGAQRIAAAALIALGDADRLTALVLAWLPPGGYRVEALGTTLGLDPRRAATSVRALARVGLAERTSGTRVRMHPLLARAIRTLPGDVDAAARRTDALHAILDVEANRRVLVDRADRPLLAAMTACLDTGPARALHWYALGRVHEYRGEIAVSAQLCARALARPDGLSPVTRAMCELGVARGVSQDGRSTADDRWHALDRVEAAIAAARDAYREDPSDDLELATQRLRAIAGILERGAAPSLPRDLRRTRLEHALDTLEDSLRSRMAILRRLGAHSLDDEDRGTFNLGGTLVELGKVAASTADAIAYYDRAARTYGTVLRIRQRRYGEVPSPHVAACQHGVAIATYYRAAAMLTAGADVASIVPLVRQAREKLDEGRRQRETLSPDRGSPHLDKSHELGVKIDLLERRVDEAGGQHPLSVRRLLAEGEGELRTLAATVVRSRARASEAAPDLEGRLRDLADAAPAPATAIAVCDPWGPLASVVHGTANLHTGDPATAEHWWDLASLTKQLVTLPVVLDLAATGAIELDESLGGQWDLAAGTPVGAATLRQLLSYRGGFPASVDLRTVATADRAALVEALLATSPVGPPRAAVYSDVGFLALGELVGHVLGRGLADVARSRGPLRYASPGAPLPGPAVATEDCPWRGRTVVGDVHDENASALGGVAGHAGAFGTLDGVSAEVRRWLATAVTHGDQAATGADLALGETSSGETGSFGLGWRLGADGTFGATGFVGNRVHVDPGRQLAVVVLANRIHPVRGDRTEFDAWTDGVVQTVTAWADDASSERER